MTEQERAAASAEHYKRMRAELDRRLSLDPELRQLSKKIQNGSADFQDTFRYSEIVSNHIGRIMQENVGTITNPLGKQYVCESLLKDHYKAINDVLGEVQVQIDEKLDIHLNPVKPPCPIERIVQVAHALEDPTVKPEVIQRRAKAPVVNVSMSFHDDYIKENAKIRAKLGLKPTITRYGSGCCKWCAEVAGRYRFGDQPKDVFRRHDNCNCTIIYDTQVLRGHQNEDGGRSKKWEEVDPKSVEKLGFTPTVNSPEQAEKLQENALNRLTKPGQGDIISHRMASSKQNPPVFANYPVREDMDAVKRVASTISSTLGIEPDKVKLDGIKNAEVLEPFVKRLQKIQSETGMKFPPICAVEVIDGDATCIAGYKPHENTLYISSRYFNSKDALTDTMKDWADNGILPKQAKSIAYLAEHESAHIRIPDDWLDSDEARDIHRRFNKTKYSNDNDKFSIEEFFADSEAWCRIAPNSAPKQMIEATEYIKRRRKP